MYEHNNLGAPTDNRPSVLQFALPRIMLRRLPSLQSAAIVACLLALASTVATAQTWTPWRIATPRECIYVPANTSLWTRTHIYASSCVTTQFTISGTFDATSNKDSNGFDAGYTYYVSNWAAPFPLKNPATWNGTTYNVYLEIDTTSGSSPSKIRLQESAYQSSHHY